MDKTIAMLIAFSIAVVGFCSCVEIYTKSNSRPQIPSLKLYQELNEIKLQQQETLKLLQEVNEQLNK